MTGYIIYSCKFIEIIVETAVTELQSSGSYTNGKAGMAGNTQLWYTIYRMAAAIPLALSSPTLTLGLPMQLVFVSETIANATEGRG